MSLHRQGRDRLSGQVLVLGDGDEVVSDPWAIACYLERIHPDQPSPFGGSAGQLVDGAPKTRGIIGAGELRRMRRSAFLINTSRAALVDQSALIQALEENWIAGAAMDVFDAEPLPAEHPFRRLPNVLATPHLGYVSEGNYRTNFTEAVQDIEAWLAGSPIRQLNQRLPDA